MIDFKIDDNGCFICTSHALGTDGYPKFKRNKKTIRLNRFIYKECFGNIPENQVVRHTCDNPSCINPEHLIKGTYQENSTDMVFRNRQAKGTKNGRSVLKDEDVRNIRLDLKRQKISVVAKKYGVSRATIWRIYNGFSWRHV